MPIGIEDTLEGIVDLVEMKAVRFTGPNGQEIVTSEIDASMMDLCKEKRALMIEKLAEVDDKIGEMFLEEKEPSPEVLDALLTTTLLPKHTHQTRCFWRRGGAPKR